MNWLINVVGKLSGASAWLGRAAPLIGSVAAILASLAHILTRVSADPSPAALLDLAKHLAASPDGAAIALGVAGIKAHFNHVQNVDRLNDHAGTINKSVEDIKNIPGSPTAP